MSRAWVAVVGLGMAGTALGAGVSVGGFLDTYYGFDFNQPAGDRSFTTQALRHDEFAINLAYVEMKLEKEKVRGRLALQGGTSVYANYAGERQNGPQLANALQYLQEAYGGYRLADGLWLDAGIYFAPYGPESFISKDNWTYTRSLAAEFSPYYEAGVRLGYQASPRWFAALSVLNGWQNLISTGSGKALGLQVAYTPTESLTIAYNNFIGGMPQLRVFHDLLIKLKLSRAWSVAISSDLGFQKGNSVWYAETLLTQLRLSDAIAVGGRLEYYHDADGVVAVTRTPNGFQAGGASVNLDWQPDSGLLLRTELRSLTSRDPIFPAASGAKTADLLWISSLALTL